MSRLPATRTIAILLSAGAVQTAVHGGCAEERPTTPAPHMANASWGEESDRIFYNARPKVRPATASQITYPDAGPSALPSGYYADYQQYEHALPDSRSAMPAAGTQPGQPTYQAPSPGGGVGTPTPQQDDPRSRATAPTSATADDEEQASKLRMARVKMRAAYENFKDAIRPAADYLRVESKRVYYESKFAINRAIDAFREAQQSEEVNAQVEASEEERTTRPKPIAPPTKTTPPARKP